MLTHLRSALRLCLLALLFASLFPAARADDSPSGYWSSSRGEMTLERANFGSFVLGRYSDANGRLSSSLLNGAVLSGEWIQPTGDHPCDVQKGTPPTAHWGRYSIEFVEEFRAFVGSWSFCDGPMERDWVGRKFAAADELPHDGVIPHNGMLPDRLKGTRNDACTCESVTLARLYSQRETAGTEFHYLIGQTDRDNITVPELSRGDRLCLQFTYPRSSAYLVAEGQPHPCKVAVGLDIPYSRSSTGKIEENWQLYAIRGMAAFRTAATNHICRGLSLMDESIPAGRGKVSINVNGIDCDPVDFSIGEAADPEPAQCPDRMPEGSKQLTCRCDPPVQRGMLYGTYYYTSDSSICGAAAHVGAIGPEGGLVTARLERGRDYYTGSVAGGIQSGAWGAYGATLVIAGVDHPERRLGMIPHCPEHWGSDQSGLCRCGADSRGSIWGSGPYTSDSNVCAAARHAGLIGAEGGLVRPRLAPGLEHYPSSTANGITTSEWGAYGGSLVLSPY